MALTKVQSGLIEATGTPSDTTFLRGDGAWATTITSGTAVSASGTAVDFTGISSTAKRITVMFDGVSTNGASNPLIQLGAGSVTTSGYLGGGIESGNTRTTFTTGFGILSSSAVNLLYGHMVLTNISSNVWVSSSNLVLFQSSIYFALTGAGSISLGGILDRLRITTVNGTDTFDAGTINILVE
jgi:hypothetical protein